MHRCALMILQILGQFSIKFMQILVAHSKVSALGMKGKCSFFFMLVALTLRRVVAIFALEEREEET